MWAPPNNFGDSVDEGGTVGITKEDDWWEAMRGLDARNPEAFRVGKGTIWADGSKGDIVEDRFYYVPKDFGWLGEEFKGVKSLVSGIGLKITNIEGERFTKDMSGVTFKSKRSLETIRGEDKRKNVLMRKLKVGRTAYYKPDSGAIWELGKGTCAIERKVGDRPVYLFFGFVEVQQGSWVGGNKRTSGYKWNFDKNKFLSEEGNCQDLLRVSNRSGYQLIQSKDGDYRDSKGQYWKGKNEKVILLGFKQGGVNGIWKIKTTQESNALIGVLMEIAVNLSYDQVYDTAFRQANNERTSELIDRCVASAKEKLEDSISKATNGSQTDGIELRSWTFGSVESQSNRNERLGKTWVENWNEQIPSKGNAHKKLGEWNQEIELSYKYH